MFVRLVAVAVAVALWSSSLGRATAFVVVPAHLLRAPSPSDGRGVRRSLGENDASRRRRGILRSGDDGGGNRGGGGGGGWGGGDGGDDDGDHGDERTKRSTTTTTVLERERERTTTIPSTSLLRSCSEWYMRQLEASPLVTKSLSSGAVALVGDLLAQSVAVELRKRRRRRRKEGKDRGDATEDLVEDDDESFVYDARRGLSVACENTFVSGPVLHLGHTMFERALPVRARKTAAAAHVLADSLLLDGFFVGSSIATSGVLEGYSWRADILPQLRRDYWSTYRAGLAVSGLLAPVEFLTFRYLPVSLRTLAINLTDVLWNSSVLFMAHRGRTGNSAAATNGATR